MQIYRPVLISENGRQESMYCFTSNDDAENFATRMLSSYMTFNTKSNAFFIVEQNVVVRGGEAVPEIIKEKDKVL